MAQFTEYRSTDSGAPVLTGLGSSLVKVLDMCLVSGYGSQTAAGWTTPYRSVGASGLTAVYKPASGIQHYFRVDDTQPGVGLGKEARFRGYGTMTDATDSGLDPYPTSGQIAAGAIIRKSATSDSTARGWSVFADNRTAIVCIYAGDNSGSSWVYYFGNIYSLAGSSDAWNSIVAARVSENSAATTPDPIYNQSTQSNGPYMARSYTTAGGAIVCRLQAHNGGNTLGGASVPFPNGPDGGIHVSPIPVWEGTTPYAGHYRGRLRGLWAPLSANANFADRDVITGSGPTAGKTWIAIKLASSGTCLIETSNTLETN